MVSLKGLEGGMNILYLGVTETRVGRSKPCTTFVTFAAASAAFAATTLLLPLGMLLVGKLLLLPVNLVFSMVSCLTIFFT